MKGVTKWSFRPYRPLLFDTGDIYICRVYPYTGQIGFDWLPAGDGAEYTVCWRRRGSGSPFETLTTKETSVLLTGLEDGTDYEFKVACGEKASRLRLARTGFVPGDAVVNYLHPDDKTYSFSGHCLCSPSIVRHPDGYLLASMDVFEGGEPQDLSLIFRSDDDGKSWKYVSELFPCFWGRMFIWQGALYMLSCNTEYGDLLIGRSDDGGRTFGMPTVLLRGSSGFKHKGVHKNPEKIMEYNGRVWMTLEWGSWASGTHAAMVGSFAAGSDPLDAANWNFTPPVPYDPSWEGAAKGDSPGCIEGSLVVFPDGKLYNVMRYHMDRCVPSFGKACVMAVDTDDPDAPLTFSRFIDFPGNHSKFEITYDEESGQYVSIVCYLDESHPSGRNLLSLIASKDAEHWYKAADLFDYSHLPESEVGFQYIAYLIEGGDILFLSRTAFNGAANFHDANYSVFTRIKEFRKLLK
ncbi:MAG: hypothetical protein K6D94_08120 [Clostridiales bacterium]|nr:hypothetical protein [Clostridiales bacterium]